MFKFTERALISLFMEIYDKNWIVVEGGGGYLDSLKLSGIVPKFSRVGRSTWLN